MCMPGTHSDAEPAASYDRDSSTSLMFLDPHGAFHAILGK